MKLYKAELCAINHDIPYFKKKLYEDKNIIQYDHVGLKSRDNCVIEKNEKHKEEEPTTVITCVKNLVVTPKFWGKVQDITTGKQFPVVKILKDYSIIEDKELKMFFEYYFTIPNQRLCVRLIDVMNHDAVKAYYETLTSEKIKTEELVLNHIIEQEQQYWNPLPKKVSNRQYVKKIEQMRNDN